MKSTKPKGLTLCPDDEAFIIAFWKEDMLVVWNHAILDLE